MRVTFKLDFDTDTQEEALALSRALLRLADERIGLDVDKAELIVPCEHYETKNGAMLYRIAFGVERVT